jgi:tetrahydromethanopterin S-methyltransferase subunit H
MSITTKNPIANELADTLTDPDTMWDSIYDWYDEVRDLDIADHYTIAELRAVGVKYADEDIIVALTTLRNAVERDIREAEKQDRWETRYWSERDYGGRL